MARRVEATFPKPQEVGNSLADQWLGLVTFMAVARVQSLVGKLRSHEPCGMADDALYVHVCVLSCLTLCDPMDYICQAPLSMESSRQEYWSGLPCPPPGDPPDPGIEPEPPALAGGFFTARPLGKPVTPYSALKNSLQDHRV